MLSKELLSAVFDTELKEVDIDKNQTEVTLYKQNLSCFGVYNIYEIAFRVKKWAYDEHFNLTSSCDGKCIVELINSNDDFSAFFKADSEVQSIFKASEWILQQI